MKKIILIGGGGHCKSVIDVIEQEKKFEIQGIVDKANNIGSNILGYKVIASDDNLQKLANRFKYALVTVGQIKSPALRIKLFNLDKKYCVVCKRSFNWRKKWEKVWQNVKYCSNKCRSMRYIVKL